MNRATKTRPKILVIQDAMTRGAMAGPQSPVVGRVKRWHRLSGVELSGVEFDAVHQLASRPSK
ncbi:hypothetical protein EFN20_11330 [Propionibacterium freudenreichii]|nr:hypothetical protein [Propionibacterium freudenreichii]MCT3006320.1 hypothetical protein [Propionibacterium freudenreichii]MCT3010426.1 hypothetical protein [Propionibacterium freudenreichii]